MIDEINIWLIRKYLSGCSQLSEFDKERIKYALSVILDEIEKVIGVLFVFILLGRLQMFFMSFVVLMSLRVFIGGIHFQKRYQCFLFTLSFFLISVFMSEIFIIYKTAGFIICCLGLTNIVLCAPLPSKHRILVSERREKRLRNRAMFIMAIWMICYIWSNKIVANLILWTVIVQQLEILYYIIFNRRKKRNDE